MLEVFNMFELKVKNNKGEVLNLSTSPNYTVFKIEEDIIEGLV